MHYLALVKLRTIVSQDQELEEISRRVKGLLCLHRLQADEQNKTKTTTATTKSFVFLQCLVCVNWNKWKYTQFWKRRDTRRLLQYKIRSNERTNGISKVQRPLHFEKWPRKIRRYLIVRRLKEEIIFCGTVVVVRNVIDSTNSHTNILPEKCRA